MTSVSKARSGQKFTRDDQLALLLIRHLGTEGAIKACYSNQWFSVLKAVEEQRSRTEPRTIM
ncbi:MAG: hypothetical protein WCF16_11020 [Alphaproteobacteria bacterium]